MNPQILERWQDMEDEMDKVLKQALSKHPLSYLRLYDSKSAGNLLPAQPADFLVSFQGVTTLIEAKFSEVNKSLRSCFSSNVDSQQIASARIWMRSGADYLFLFYSKVTFSVEVWPGQHCIECRSEGKPLQVLKRRTYSSTQKALEEEIGWLKY